jgi:hypothetical protein
VKNNRKTPAVTIRDTAFDTPVDEVHDERDETESFESDDSSVSDDESLTESSDLDILEVML